MRPVLTDTFWKHSRKYWISGGLLTLFFWITAWGINCRTAQNFLIDHTHFLHSGRWQCLENTLFYHQISLMLFLFPLLCGFVYLLVSDVLRQKEKYILSMAVLLIFGLGSIDNGQNWGDDFAAYIQQAKCLLNGSDWESYLQVNRFISDNSDIPLGPHIYPWGYPLLLSIPLAAAGQSFFYMKLINLAAMLLFFSSVYYLFHERLRQHWLSLLCLLLFFPEFFLNCNELKSDLLFMAVSTFSILLLTRYFRDSCSQNYIYGFAAGACIGFSCLVRTNGILLLAALAAVQLWCFICKKQRFSFFYWTAPWITAGLLIILDRFLLPHSDSNRVLLFFQAFSIKMVLDNLIWYLLLMEEKMFRENFFLLCGTGFVVWVLWLAAVLRGLWLRCRNMESDEILFLIYSVMTLVLYILWRGNDIRFLYPVIPFALYWMLTGLTDCWDRLHNFLAVRHILLLFLLFIVLTGLSLISFRIIRLHTSGNPLEALKTPDTLDLAEYIRNHVPENSVIIFFKPRALYLMTGRKALHIFRPENIVRGDYYCHTEDPQDQSGIFREKFKEHLTECFGCGPFRLYRIRKDHPDFFGSIHNNCNP